MVVSNVKKHLSFPQLRNSGPKSARSKSYTTKFAAGLVALSLTISGVAATPAQADEADVALALGGHLTLFVVGKAIDDAKDRKSSSSRSHHKHTSSKHTRNGHRHKGRAHSYSLPRQCVGTVKTRNHRSRHVVFENCVKKARRASVTLPLSCKTHVRTKSGRTSAYGLGCLTKRGYSVARG